MRSADSSARSPRPRGSGRAPGLRRMLTVALLLAAGHVLAQAESHGTAVPEAATGTVTMDFQDVDIGVLTKFISEVTGRNFIVDDRVTGTVTIIAPEKITPDEAYAVFQSVLQV